VKPLIYGYTRSPHTLADAETARLDLAAGVRGAVVHALDEVAELAGALRASRSRDVVIVSLRELASGEALRESMVARLDLAAGVSGAVVHALDEVAGFEPGRTAAQPLTTDGETHGEAR
jgi:hypothetical protein